VWILVLLDPLALLINVFVSLSILVGTCAAMCAEPKAHTLAWPKPVLLGVYHAFYLPAPTSTA